MRLRKWILFCSCIAVLRVHAHDRALQAVVDQHVPEGLLAKEEGFAAPIIRSAFVTTNFSRGNDDSGKKYLLAAYANGSEGAVRVLRRHGQEWTALSTTDIADEVSFPALQLRDLDGDRIPEVIASFLIGPGDHRGSWIFGWNDQANALVSMESDGGSPTEIVGAGIVERFIDLDGDDKLDIVRVDAIKYDYIEDADGEPGPLRPTDEVRYVTERLHGRLYQRWKDLAFYGSFGPTGGNGPESVTFEAAKPGRDYLLRIASSGSCKNPDIRSAEVGLNGALIAGPAQFKSKNCVIQIPVLLLQENALTVRILDSRKSKESDGHEHDEKGDEEKEAPTLVVTIEPS